MSTRFADRFYNLKIGIPWADLERRLDPGTVLSLAGDVTGWRDGDHVCCMGVDTGKKLHVVILRRSRRGKQLVTLIDLRICSTFEDLDYLMERYQIWKCGPGTVCAASAGDLGHDGP